MVPADDLEDDCDAHQDSNNNNTTSEFATAMDGDHSLLTHGHGHGHLHGQGTSQGYMHASQVTLLPPILSHALPPHSLSVPAPRPRPDEIWLGEMRSPSPGLAGLGLGINFGGYPGRFTEHFSGGIAAMLAPPKMPLAPMPASSATRGTTPTHARCPTPIQRVLFAGSPDLDTYKDPFFPPIEFSLYT